MFSVRGARPAALQPNTAPLPPRPPAEAEAELFRVSTPPLVKQYRKRANENEPNELCRVRTPPLLQQHEQHKQLEHEQDAAGAAGAVVAPPKGVVMMTTTSNAGGAGTLVRQVQLNLSQHSGAFRVLRGASEDSEEEASGSDLERRSLVSSPCSLTAGGASTTEFSNTAVREMSRELDMLVTREDKANGGGAPSNATSLMFFQTGVSAASLPDSSLSPPEYKAQFTVTGAVRQVKLKREGPSLGRRVEVNGIALALFRYQSRIYAIANTCCHQGGPLCDGDIEDLCKIPQVAASGVSAASEAQTQPQATREPLSRAGASAGAPRPQPVVACPWHGWRFNLESGRCLHKDSLAQPVYPCKVDKGEVLVGFEKLAESTFDDADF
jgi:nitrite reductase (NADH) small subunit